MDNATIGCTQELYFTNRPPRKRRWSGAPVAQRTNALALSLSRGLTERYTERRASNLTRIGSLESHLRGRGVRAYLPARAEIAWRTSTAPRPTSVIANVVATTATTRMVVHAGETLPPPEGDFLDRFPASERVCLPMAEQIRCTRKCSRVDVTAGRGRCCATYRS